MNIISKSANILRDQGRDSVVSFLVTLFFAATPKALEDYECFVRSLITYSTSDRRVIRAATLDAAEQCKDRARACKVDGRAWYNHHQRAWRLTRIGVICGAPDDYSPAASLCLATDLDLLTYLDTRKAA